MHAVVVGGGIVGLASGFELAERGVDVTLCERGSLGGESTQRSVGGIRTQFSTPVNVDLSLLSLDVWEEFEARFGVDVGHRRNGYLFLAREEETAAAFRENVAMQNDRGGKSAFLSPETAVEHCPGLHPEAFAGATYSPLDGFADPNLAAQGYAGALAEHGVDVRTKTAVTDVRVADGRVTGVETDDGTIAADYVVNAAGAWAGELAAMAGVDLPILPKRRQAMVAAPETPVPEDVPLTVDLDRGAYFRPEREGAAIAGGHFGGTDPTQDPADYDGDSDLDWAVDCLERLEGWTDYFGPDAAIKRGWAGLYAVTPDHHAILEESVPGFVVAAGSSGHGFQHAPATGKIVADLVVEGGTDRVDLDPLGSDRFETGELRREQNVA